MLSLPSYVRPAPARTRHRAALLAVPLLLVSVAACGDDGDEASSDKATTAAESVEAIPGVEIAGEVGEVPEVTIDTPLKLDKTQTSVLSEGEGGEVVEGEEALLHLYVANGTTGKKAAATFDQGMPASVLVSEDQIFPSVVQAIVGQPTGSRVAVAAVPKDAYPAGADQIGISAEDSVVFVVDIMSVAPEEVLSGPEGETADVPGDLPAVVEKDGNVTELTWADAPKDPGDELQVIPLIEGDGPPARDASLVTVDYFGQIYGSEKVFDESFSKDEPVTFALGTGNLIKAWDEGLVGVKQGSRVLVIAPPEYGYGEAGQPQGGIKGTDTLAFVVDILGVS